MPTARHIQTSINAGEFDPLLWSREDVSFFYNSARKIENIVPLPQGGAKRREGWRFRALQRGEISAISLAGATITATNGGTVGNATDGDPATKLLTTAAIGVTAIYEIIKIDMLAATSVYMVDLDLLRFVTLPGGITSASIAVQHSPDNAVWTTAALFDVGTATHNRRFAMQPDTALGNRRYWRIVCLNATDLTTAVVEFGEIRFKSEAGKSAGSPVLGNFTSLRLTADITNEFVLYLVAGNADIFSASTGAWLAAVEITHDDSEVEAIKHTTSLDTAILYHEDVAQFQIQKLQGTINWGSKDVVFDSVVQFPFTNGDVSGGVNEVQFVSFESMAVSDKFLFEFAGQTSDEILWNGTPATNVTNMTNALEGLDDVTSVTVTSLGSDDYEIEFDGVDAKTAFPIMVIDILTGSGLVTLSHEVFGRPDTDALWSETRGFPRCGTFYQGRHWMGGFKARPDLLAASIAGSLFDFKQDIEPVAGSAIVVAPNADEQITIQNIFAGRHLQIFTSSVEIFVPDEPITVDNIALKISGRSGNQSLTQPVDIQGGTLFVDRNGRALREYLFQDALQSYTAEPVSILSGHLMSSPRSMAMRRARDVDEPTLVLLANTGKDRDGLTVPAAIIAIDRAQQVTGFARIKTNGVPLAFVTAQNGEAFAITQRDLDGITWNYLEQFDDEYMSDCGVKITNTAFDDFTATPLQTVFIYTFTSPTLDTDVAVWSRTLATDDFVRVSSADYTVDLGAKTVTFAVGRPTGDLVHINLRQATASLVGAAEHLDNELVFVHGDGLPINLITVTGNAVDLGDDRFDFECEVGLQQLPLLVLHPYKGRGDTSPTMQKMRIFRALLQFERTGGASIGMAEGETKAISLQNFDSGLMDPVLEEVLFTGPKRISGIGRWQLEPTLVITQLVPMPFLLRSVTYDVRF